MARIAYEPGLDGLRAVALLAIFVVHADIGRASGGFLAVSTFFTLSGFLITSLLVIEHRSNGHIGLGAFWARRARRLLPASLVAITAIGAATVLLGDAGQLDQLGGDTVAALTYVANWRFVALGTRYGGGFEGESPLLHFWSLAIEEQFYIVFPLLCTVAFRLARRWRHAVAVVFATGIAASLAAGVVGSLDSSRVDRLYFGTDVRAGELLVGALVGLWWVDRRHRLSPSTHVTIRLSGAVLLLVMLGLIATAKSPDLVWYRGGLIAYSLVTCGVVLAAVEARGPVRSLLAWRPLVAIGRISYGGYLFHWPVFLWLRAHTDIPGLARLLAGTALSLALAAVSSRLIERPVRERRWTSRPALIGAGSALALAAIVVAVLVAPRWGRSSQDVALADVGNRLEQSLHRSAAAPGQAPTIGLYGDSTALVMSLGLSTWDDTHTTVRATSGWASLGCSILSPTQFREADGVHDTPALCADWLGQWRKAAAVDVAMVMFGPWEVGEIKPPGGSDFETLGNPELDAAVTDRLRAGIDALLPHAGVVVLTTSPYIERGRLNGRSPTEASPDSDHGRMDRLNAIIRSVAAGYPRVALLDLGGYLDQPDIDRRMRPDGVHLTTETALELADRLAPTLASLAPRTRNTAPAGSEELLPVIKRAVTR